MAAPKGKIADPFGLVGRTLEGQFRVDAVIGEGGFSIVYRGMHLGLEEPIAIKCLKLDATLGTAVVETFVTKFRDEGRILYRLSQGNLHIVRSIASGTTVAPGSSSLVPYTILEWLEGLTLLSQLEMRRERGATPRTLNEVITLLDCAADAVAYAHSQGVVHRDLNPGNIFLTSTRDGVKAKVLDFGIAKIVSDSALELGPRAPTLAQIKVFSPAYASPEQMDEGLGKVGPWSDVYTFAVVFLETLSDRMVFEGDSLAELLAKILNRAFRPTPKTHGLLLGSDLEDLFAHALALNPQERPTDLGDFWGRLKNGARKLPPDHLIHRPNSTPPPKRVTSTLRLRRPAGGMPVDTASTSIDPGPPGASDRPSLPPNTLRMDLGHLAELVTRESAPAPRLEAPSNAPDPGELLQNPLFSRLSAISPPPSRDSRSSFPWVPIALGAALAVVFVFVMLFVYRM